MRERGITSEDIDISERLCTFVRESPSPFHTITAIRDRLVQAGFTELSESEFWDIRQGKGYYTIRNGSSIIAFRVGIDVMYPRFQIVSSHSDSPTFRVKHRPELHGPGSYMRLNVEGYGGVIDRTWLDRPLSLAGRVMVRSDDMIQSRLFAPDEDLLIIPSLAIHLDRDVNSSGALRRNVDLYPLLSAGQLSDGCVKELMAKELGVDSSQVLSYDLVLVNRQEPLIWGAQREFVSGPRLDDLQCAFSSLSAFLDSRNESCVTVFACFDNEEVGSGTMQGARSTFMPRTLKRISRSMGLDDGTYQCAISDSFLVSCDNAHAVHPNHPELYDEGNRVWLNEGVVVKESAAQRYTTIAPARALFETVCRSAGVPVQAFANRSDLPGGSTLGNLLMSQVSMHAVDVGCPQLAMHSSYETIGTRDTSYMMRALREFYNTDYVFESYDSIRLR